MTTKQPTAAAIWQTLTRANIRPHVYQKNGLNYLPWAYAWGVMMLHFPECRVDWRRWTDAAGAERDVIYYADGTAAVCCTVSIGDISREVTLAVMGHKNDAIQSPTSVQIGKTRQRAMVKGLAMFGLGIELWMRDGLPVDHDAEWDEDQRRFCAAIGKLGVKYDDLRDWCLSHDRQKPSSMGNQGRRALYDELASGRIPYDDVMTSEGATA